MQELWNKNLTYRFSNFPNIYIYFLQGIGQRKRTKAEKMMSNRTPKTRSRNNALRSQSAHKKRIWRHGQAIRISDPAFGWEEDNNRAPKTAGNSSVLSDLDKLGKGKTFCDGAAIPNCANKKSIMKVRDSSVITAILLNDDAVIPNFSKHKIDHDSPWQFIEAMMLNALKSKPWRNWMPEKILGAKLV